MIASYCASGGVYTALIVQFFPTLPLGSLSTVQCLLQVHPRLYKEFFRPTHRGLVSDPSAT